MVTMVFETDDLEEGVVDHVEDVSLTQADYIQDIIVTEMNWDYNLYYNASNDVFKHLFTVKTASMIPYSPGELKSVSHYGLPSFRMSSGELLFDMPVLTDAEDDMSIGARIDWAYGAGVDIQVLLANHRSTRQADGEYKISQRVISGGSGEAPVQEIKNSAIDAMAVLFAAASVNNPAYNDPDVWRQILQEDKIDAFITGRTITDTSNTEPPTEPRPKLLDVLFRTYNDGVSPNIRVIDPIFLLLRYWQRANNTTVFSFNHGVQRRYREFFAELNVHLTELVSKFVAFAGPSQWAAIGAPDVAIYTFGQVYYNMLREYYVRWNATLDPALILQFPNPFAKLTGALLKSDNNRLAISMIDAAKSGLYLPPNRVSCDMSSQAICPAFSTMVAIVVGGDLVINASRLSDTKTPVTYVDGSPAILIGGDPDTGGDTALLGYHWAVSSLGWRSNIRYGEAKLAGKLTTSPTNGNLYFPRATEFKWIFALGTGVTSATLPTQVPTGDQSGMVSNELNKQYAYTITSPDVRWLFATRPDQCLKISQFVNIKTQIDPSDDVVTLKNWKVSLCADKPTLDLAVFYALYAMCLDVHTSQLEYPELFYSYSIAKLKPLFDWSQQHPADTRTQLQLDIESKYNEIVAWYAETGQGDLKFQAVTTIEESFIAASTANNTQPDDTQAEVPQDGTQEAAQGDALAEALSLINELGDTPYAIAARESYDNMSTYHAFNILALEFPYYDPEGQRSHLELAADYKSKLRDTQYAPEVNIKYQTMYDTVYPATNGMYSEATIAEFAHYVAFLDLYNGFVYSGNKYTDIILAETLKETLDNTRYTTDVLAKYKAMYVMLYPMSQEDIDLDNYNAFILLYTDFATSPNQAERIGEALMYRNILESTIYATEVLSKFEEMLNAQSQETPA